MKRRVDLMLTRRFRVVMVDVGKGVIDMDHFEIINEVMIGKTLEITSQTNDNKIAKAYLDGEPVSVSQSVRSSNSGMIKVSASQGEWSEYIAA